jgi:DNA helicase-2/ATP-dependent DNA helicase PcrA
MNETTQRAAEEPVAVVLDGVVEATGFEAYLERTHRGEGLDRMENVRALVSAAAEYEKEPGEHTLQGFLDRSALVSDADEVGARPGVTLMTIHNAKGLEFPVVFLAGLEENLFPHARSVGSSEDLEEERRLCYVAMTRAKSRLFLSHAMVRLVQGVPVPNPRSRFLSEVREDLIEEAVGEPGFTLGEAPGWRGYDREPSFGSSAARAVRRIPPAVSPLTGNVILQDAADGFPVGATVEHPMFGPGRILEREGSGAKLKLTIHFVGYGAKKILPAYTKLQVASR